MINIKGNKECCGCHACYSICPKNAITMKEDEKGFKYPIINKTKCIDCGLCEKICPIINRIDDEKKNIEIYACYNKNAEERINSSSGGIFILLAKKIIKMGGVVFGAELDDNFNVIHSFAETEEDIKKFMGSKYVQSTIGNTYKKAKEFLDEGKYVLFTGTPCQIEGLKSYLQKKYDKLYTQDIICHGVPSPIVWNKYKEYREKVDGEQPQKIYFRNKDNGWRLYNMKFIYKNGTYMENQTKDSFIQAFLKNTILRDSCYNCSFKKKYRNSDITIADYWGVQKIHPDIFDDKGTSLVIVNSIKGEKLFHLIKDEMQYQETNLDEALKYNPAMIKSVNKDNNREMFFENIDKLDFDKLVKKYTYQPHILEKIISNIKAIIKKVIRR